MTGQVAEAVKDERLQRLQALLAEQQRDFAAGHGRQRRSTLLIEKPGRQPASGSAARPGCSR